MTAFEYTIKDSLGIHARPAGLLVKEAQKLTSDIEITCGDKTASLKKLFAVMGLGVKCGDTVTVKVSGADEKADSEAIESFFKSHL